MEKRLNNKVELYISKLKNDIRDKLIGENIDQGKLGSILEYIYDYQRLEIIKEDFIKRKRVKNSIPENNRCLARRANNEQCTRRRKCDSNYCGTHCKGTPHGIVDLSKTTICDEHVMEVYAKEIQGIVYYLDNFNNVYKPEDILSSKKDPEVVAKYENINNKITIPSLGLI